MSSDDLDLAEALDDAEEDTDSAKRRRHFNYDEPESDDDYERQFLDVDAGGGEQRTKADGTADSRKGSGLEDCDPNVSLEDVRLTIRCAQNSDDAAVYFHLAKLYRGNNYLPYDKNKLYLWLLLAAEKQYAPAVSLLRSLRDMDRRLPDNSAAALLVCETDCVISIEDLSREAACGDSLAMVQLGNRYLRGIGGAVKDDKAAFEYLSASFKAYPWRLTCYDLGLIYEQGSSCCPQDRKLAAEMFERAARMRFVLAMMHLGSLCMDGFEDGPEYAQAFYWFKKAAEECEYYPAYGPMGYLLANGLGTKADADRAFILYTRGARRGDAYAQYLLGCAYLNGIGTPADKQQAFKWLKKAAANGWHDAEEKLDALGVAFVPETDPNLPPEIAAIAVPEAVMPPPAAVDSAVSLADAPEELRRRCAELKQAGLAERAKQAEEEGASLAAAHLGHLCLEIGESKSAFAWYQLAARQGCAEAQYNLAWMLANGKGTAKDLGRARNYYALAAQQGYARAQYNLSVMIARGQGGSRDYKQALKWCWSAAEQGLPEAQYLLGMMLSCGEVVNADAECSQRWLERAAAQGHSRAQARLEKLSASQ